MEPLKERYRHMWAVITHQCSNSMCSVEIGHQLAPLNPNEDEEVYDIRRNTR